jgi:hypothetical protein
MPKSYAAKAPKDENCNNTCHLVLGNVDARPIYVTNCDKIDCRALTTPSLYDGLSSCERRNDTLRARFPCLGGQKADVPLAMGPFVSHNRPWSTYDLTFTKLDLCRA